MRRWRQAFGSAQGGVGRGQDLDLQGVVAPGVQVQHLKQEPHLHVQPCVYHRDKRGEDQPRVTGWE